MRLRRWAWLGWAVLGAAACVRGQPVPERCESAFPPGVDEGCAFTQDLVALKERPLWPVVPGQRDTFRVLVILPMQNPFLVRAVRSRVGWDVIAAESMGRRPDALRREHSVLAQEIEPIQRLLDEADFWAGPFEEGREVFAIHPCIAFLEGVRDGRYSVAQVIEEPRSERARAVVTAARALLRVGGLESRYCGTDPPLEFPATQ